MFIVDYAESVSHLPACREACAAAGEDLARVQLRGLFDPSFRCQCAGTRRVMLAESWRQHVDWIAAEILTAAALFGLASVVRALWRARRDRAAPPT